MTSEEFIDLCSCGETTTVQFKQEFTTGKKMAEEMVAFSNTIGGVILLGVEDKTGKLVGMTYEQIQNCTRELGNTANEQVRPAIYITTEVVRAEDKHFLVCGIKQGKGKPYKTTDGTIWVKQGSDKRRVTDNNEILELFQDAGTFQTDAASVPETTKDDIDRRALNQYFKKVYRRDLEFYGDDLDRVLRNIHVLRQDNTMTLAGYLFFGKEPERLCPTFCIKAVAFYGNTLGGMNYRDSKDLVGSVPELYDKAMSFMKQNLHTIQNGSFNAPGKLEIEEEVLEEILQNALVHRDYLRSAPIRILIFDDRLEIVSPGCLAGGLTVEAVRMGDTFQRNPYLATFCTNGMNYRGLGSGMLRVLGLRPDVEITNDIEGKQLTITLKRKVWKGTEKVEKEVEKGTEKVEKEVEKETFSFELRLEKKQQEYGIKLGKTKIDILKMIYENSTITTTEMAEKLQINTSAVNKHLLDMRDTFIKNVGGRRYAQWVVLLD